MRRAATSQYDDMWSIAFYNLLRNKTSTSEHLIVWMRCDNNNIAIMFEFRAMLVSLTVYSYKE